VQTRDYFIKERETLELRKKVDARITFPPVLGELDDSYRRSSILSDAAGDCKRAQRLYDKEIAVRKRSQRRIDELKDSYVQLGALVELEGNSKPVKKHNKNALEVWRKIIERSSSAA
jgi:hypothetical protein